MRHSSITAQKEYVTLNHYRNTSPFLTFPRAVVHPPMANNVQNIPKCITAVV